MRTSRLLTTVLAAGLTTLAAAQAGPAAADPSDGTPPDLAVTGVRWPTFFPAVDGYKDATRVDYTVTDDVSSTVTVEWRVTDAVDAVVRSGEQTVTTGAGSVRWDGTSASGLVDAGDYTLTLVALDEAGNRAEQAQELTVDRGRLVTRTFRRTVGPRDSTVERQVGRCSSLRYPAPRRDWIGSLGYHSNTRCARSGRASYAATVNGLYVPYAHEDPDYPSFYRTLTVKVFGGAARSRDRSRAQLQCWKRSGETRTSTRVLGPRVGPRAGQRAPAAPSVLRDDEGAPYVLWNLLTAQGNRYNVKTFTVVLPYQDLVQPGAPRAAARVPAGRTLRRPGLRRSSADRRTTRHSRNTARAVPALPGGCNGREVHDSPGTRGIMHRCATGT